MINHGDPNKVKIIEQTEDLHLNEDVFSSMGIYHMWVHENTMGEGVKVAVVDTGIDINHEEFKDSFKSGVNMLNQTPDVTDDNGHGSFVAGLIAGKNIGIAPKSELYIAKVLDEKGKGSITNILDGITFAINHNVDVLCLSLGSTYDIPVILKERIIKAYNNGITIVCATGNHGRNTVNYPSNMREIIAVGGLDKEFDVASFSNYGKGKEVDTVAPSIDILSAYKDGDYAEMTGTSMATAIVTGAISLLISHYRSRGIELLPSDIKDKISTLGEHNDKYGYGMIDLRKLIYLTDATNNGIIINIE